MRPGEQWIFWMGHVERQRTARIERALEFRAQAFATRCATDLSGLRELREHRIRRLCAFSTRPPGFFGLNGYDTLATRRDGLFAPEHAHAHRPCMYLNYLLTCGFVGDYLFNTCDASGWDYSALGVPEDYPVFQYTRLKTQRDRVVLVPLPDKYMSPLSRNVPQPGYDSLRFDQKRPSAIWRGTTKGTSPKPDGGAYWMNSVIDAVLKGDTRRLALLDRFTRFQVADASRGSELCDAGLVIGKWDRCRDHLDDEIVLRLDGLVKPAMSRQTQLEHRYLLALEGNDAPSSLWWSLASNSVVLMPEPTWETVLTEDLVAWTHYVPIKSDGSDVEDQIAYCERNPGQMKEIVAAAQAYMRWMSDLEYRDAVDFAVFAMHPGASAPRTRTASLYDFAP